VKPSPAFCIFNRKLAGHAGGKGPHWVKIQDNAAPPFDLKVPTATYLGDGKGASLLPVSVELLDSGADTLVVVAGNGQFAFGLEPTPVLGASAQSNGSIVIFTLSATGALSASALIKVGERCDHVSVTAGGLVAVVGDFGAALLQLPDATHNGDFGATPPTVVPTPQKRHN
jgi:hypothetical protein